MTNIVMLACCKIRSTGTLEFNQEYGNEGAYTLYHAMHEIVCHSAETFIQEDFEFVIIEEDVDSYQQVFHNNWQHVRDVWDDEGPNNILFLDTDTLIIKPVEIFGKLNEFQMFNYTDPKELSGADANNRYGLKFKHYFNAGVRYYPDTMSEELWNVGQELANEWDYNIWGTEQIIFNQMMYSQNPDVKHWLKPEYGFQAMQMRHNLISHPEINDYLENWNGMHLNDAKILHLHGTRGAANTVLLQWNLWKRVTGEEFEFSKVEVIKDTNGNAVNLKPRETNLGL